MKDFFSGVFQKSSEYVGAHKIISLIILLVIVGGGYEIVHSFQSTSTPTQYVLGTVQKGTVLSSVTGTGQVSTTNQVNLQAQASGTVTYVGVQAGDTVKQGKLLVELDDRSAQKALRDAETNLQSAQLALQKLQEPPTTADVTTLKNDIANAKSSEDSAAETVKEAYTTLLNSSTIASASDGSSSQSAPTIIGNYQKGEAGQIVISFYQSGGNQYFSASSVPTDIVPNTLGTVSSTIPQPIADTGLYIEFPSNAHSGTWIITLPNKSAANYLANYAKSF